ncbi:MAG: hypothetical protein ABII64_08205 [Elusimicrobiota bacterium]
MKYLLFLFIPIILISGCSYTYNPRARAERKADLLETRGYFFEAHRLRHEAPFLPEERTGHFIPIIQTPPDEDILKRDPYHFPEHFSEYRDYKNYEFNFTTTGVHRNRK